MFLLFFGDSIRLYSPGYPAASYIDQVGLQLTELPLDFGLCAGIEAVCAVAGFNLRVVKEATEGLESCLGLWEH